MKNKDFENTLNMSVADFFEKMKLSGKYKVYDIRLGLWDDEIISSYGDTPIYISYISDNDMLEYSPYNEFYMERINGGTFYRFVSEGKSIEISPDAEMSYIVRNIEHLVNEHYRVLFRNIKKVIDSGYRYILDNWSGEYEYLQRNAKKHGIKYVMNWEDCYGYMIITEIDIEEDKHIEATTYQYHRKK